MELFHLASHKGVVDSFTYNLRTVSSNHGSTRNGNERRDSPKPGAGFISSEIINMEIHLLLNENEW